MKVSRLCSIVMVLVTITGCGHENTKNGYYKDLKEAYADPNYFDKLNKVDGPEKAGFADFDVLKAGATKVELEKHFKIKFNNRIKDPDTGAYEEIVPIKVMGVDVGTMIIGFDEKDKLFYLRDILNKKITYPKPKL